MDRTQIERDIDRVSFEKNENLLKVANIKSQIDSAKAGVISEGLFSDPKWFASANSALRHSGRRDQELAAQLGQLKRLLKELNLKESNSKDRVSTFELAFVNIAKRKLTGEMFEAIRDAALVAIS